MLKGILFRFFLILCLATSYVGAVHSFEFGAFSDVTVGDSSATGENPQFALGGLDFYGTTKIDNKTRVFVEYVFENTSDGLVTDLERLWISRQITDGLNIGVGRFHTPLGSWNRSYHHGAILQDTISRPFFLDFEDGQGAILPVHIVGLLATGSVTIGMGDLNYEFYIANGPSIDTSVAVGREIEINGEGDPNADKSVGFRSTLELSATEMSLSIFGMFNKIADSGGTLTAQGDPIVTQIIGGADAYIVMSDFDLLAELYYLQNKDEVGALGTQGGVAFFAQFGYQFMEKWKVVFRHEQVLTKEGSDRYFKEIGTRDAANEILAVRYDLDDTNSLKFEVKFSNPDDDSVDDTTSVKMQWAFLVP